jgi:hypothetical protein
MKQCHVFLFLLAAGCANASSSPEPGAKTHAELVKLYEEFRQFRVPEITNGVPDYTPAAMTRKQQGLAQLQQRWAAFDTSGWSLAERIDYMVVIAEMNGMEFDHRVLRPWSRDPAFYVVINFQFGPKMYGASGLPSLPLAATRVDTIRQRLNAIPAILDQARSNLTEPTADLAMLGVRTKNREEGLLIAWIEQLKQHHSDLVPDAERALTSIRSFRDWLETSRKAWTGPSGIGADNFTWFMHNVMFLPYSWEELVTITERDLDRALALMTLEEHRNRKLPPMKLANSLEEYASRHTAAQKTLLDIVQHEEVMTIPDFIQVEAPTEFERGPQRDYFQNVNDRDPLALLPHEFLVHAPDAQRRNRDSRPIRGARRLYFVDGQRQDGLATAMEQIMMHLGSLDGRPRARELGHNLLALRAVRAMADLDMHGNRRTLEEAFQYNIDNTPKGWLPENSSTMWHDLELYLRQPGYGIGYLIGVAQIEELLAERAIQLGDKFNLKTFMDDFLASGLIPISLIRWEITGRDDQIRNLGVELVEK